MRYVMIVGVLLLTGCATMDRLVYGEITPEDERARAETKCPTGQEARLVGYMLPGAGGVGPGGWQVLCLPTRASSTR